MKIKKTILIIGIVALVIVAFVFGFAITGKVVSERQENTKIGAVLILSGPASVWGESVQNGMELAREELEQENVFLDIVYEDSQAQAGQGISAYRKLVDVNSVDVVFSMFSRVSVPLIPLAEEDEIPLIMTVVAANGVAEQSPYAFRFYSTESQYAEPHFDIFAKKGYSKISVLYINDEYGVSVRDAIKRKAAKEEISVIDEAFGVGNSDYKTQLAKIKSSNSEAIMFVGTLPNQINNVLEQREELGVGADFFDASPLYSIDFIRDMSGNQNIYTLAFPFTFGEEGGEFREKYQDKYGEEPFFAAAFGYDMIKLVALASEKDKLIEGIYSVGVYDSLNGPVEIKKSGEINPELRSVKVSDGELVEV